VIDGHEELVPVRVLDGHVLVLAERVAHGAHLEEAADPVVAVDDHVARAELHDERALRRGA